MKNSKLIKCLLCGNPADLKQEEFPGFQEPEKFCIYACINCNTSFSFPRVQTSKIYENIYENGNSVPGYERYWKYSKEVKNVRNPLKYLSNSEETYWAVKKALASLTKKKESTNILEIGSGLGYLTYSLRKAHYKVVGLDISQVAVDRAKEAFGDFYICADLIEFAKLNAEKYDIVILTEVIEHIDQPLEFIKSIVALLKSGGHAIITTPNKSLYPSNIIWATELPPVHCWWFSEESMKYISKCIKAKISFINFKNYYRKTYYPVRLDDMPFSPVFDNDGNLINGLISPNYQRSFLRKILSKISIAKIVYTKLKELSNSDKLICKERGIILGIIFEKS